MKIKSFLLMLTIGLLFTNNLYSQTPVTVVESSIKVGLMGEEFFYYGFAKGDKIIFSFNEDKGKEIKEFEIVEMPATSRFRDYKTKKIENKTINVPATGIYKFRFTNSSIIPRICNYKVQRIPASEATKNFNCTVYFRQGFDTTYTSETEQFISYADTVINNFQDRATKIYPAKNAPNNKATFNFILPENTVAWSYYISTDSAGIHIYDTAYEKLKESNNYIVKKYPRSTPLLALALNQESYLVNLNTGSEINYWIVENENAELFMNGEQFRYMKKGKSVNDYSKMENRKGTLNFCFANELPDEEISVNVKITSIQVNPFMDSRTIKRIVTTPKNEMYLKN